MSSRRSLTKADQPGLFAGLVSERLVQLDVTVTFVLVCSSCWAGWFLFPVLARLLRVAHSTAFSSSLSLSLCSLYIASVLSLSGSTLRSSSARVSKAKDVAARPSLCRRKQRQGNGLFLSLSLSRPVRRSRAGSR